MADNLAVEYLLWKTVSVDDLHYVGSVELKK